jgi:hypothetical protein
MTWLDALLQFADTVQQQRPQPAPHAGIKAATDMAATPLHIIRRVEAAAATAVVADRAAVQDPAGLSRVRRCRTHLLKSNH